MILSRVEYFRVESFPLAAAYQNCLLRVDCMECLSFYNNVVIGKSRFLWNSVSDPQTHRHGLDSLVHQDNMFAPFLSTPVCLTIKHHIIFPDLCTVRPLQSQRWQPLSASPSTHPEARHPEVKCHLHKNSVILSLTETELDLINHCNVLVNNQVMIETNRDSYWLLQ